MIVLELEVIKETPQKRITLVRELDKRNIYIKKELKTYNKTIWEKLKQLDIEGIPHIYSIEENEDGLEIIEEYLACQTLSDILDEHTFSNLEAYQIIRQLCIILDVLHQQDPQIIHRDIKPDNILVDSNGNIKLIDYDAARIYIKGKEQDTVLLGTAGYAAPEQYGIVQSNIRTDIYSLGVLINVMLTGEHPSKKMCSGRYRKIVEKCTRINPDDRYYNISELRKHL